MKGPGHIKQWTTGSKCHPRLIQRLPGRENRAWVMWAKRQWLIQGQLISRPRISTVICTVEAPPRPLTQRSSPFIGFPMCVTSFKKRVCWLRRVLKPLWGPIYQSVSVKILDCKQQTPTVTDLSRKVLHWQHIKKLRPGNQEWEANMPQNRGVRSPLPRFQTRSCSLCSQQHHPCTSLTASSHTLCPPRDTILCKLSPWPERALHVPELSVPQAPNSKIRMDASTCRACRAARP